MTAPIFSRRRRKSISHKEMLISLRLLRNFAWRGFRLPAASAIDRTWIRVRAARLSEEALAGSRVVCMRLQERWCSLVKWRLPATKAYRSSEGCVTAFQRWRGSSGRRSYAENADVVLGKMPRLAISAEAKQCPADPFHSVAVDCLCIARQQRHDLVQAKVCQLKRRAVPIFEVAAADNPDHERWSTFLACARDVAGEGPVPSLLGSHEAVELRRLW